MAIFEAELSVDSLNKLAKQLKEYGNELDDSLIYINTAIANRAYELIAKYIKYDTGELLDSVVTQVTKEFAYLYTDKDYAKFVEFGTGIKGKGSPHPEAKGYGWSYGGEYTGQTAGKFMWKTSIEIEKELETIALRVLKERGLLE